jgi:hypothetical protein
MGLREIEWEGVDCIHLAQDKNQWWAVVNTVMNLWVPLQAVNFLTSRVTISFSRRIVLHSVSHRRDSNYVYVVIYQQTNLKRFILTIIDDDVCHVIWSSEVNF